MATLGEMMSADKKIKSILQNYQGTKEENDLLLNALQVYDRNYKLPFDNNNKLDMNILQPFIDENFKKIQKAYSKKLMNHFATISMFDD